MVATLVTAEGRLVLCCADGVEVHRAWQPDDAERSGSSRSFSPGAVTEAWLVTDTVRVRAFVVGGRVTAVSGWMTATGAPLPPDRLPRPPPAVTAILDWTASTDRAPPSTDDLAAAVDAILAEELATLRREGSVAPTFERGTEVTGRTGTVERTIESGCSIDGADQTGSSPPTNSTTRNIFVEYGYTHTWSSDEVDRTLTGSGSFGTAFDTLSVEYRVGSPAAARRRTSGGLSLGFEGEKSADPLAVDTVTFGLTADTERPAGSSLEWSGRVAYDAVDYAGGTTSTFGSRSLDGSLTLVGSAGEATYEVGLTFDAWAYPDDRAADNRERSLHVAAWGSRSRLDWDLRASSSTHAAADTGSVSLQTGTTADDYDERNLSTALGWRFTDSLSSRLEIAWSTRSYDHPDAWNTSNDTFEMEPSVDWELGRGWSATLAAAWSMDRHRDRDGDDGSTAPAIRESMDDMDERRVETSLLHSTDEVSVSLGASWSREHYPASNQTVVDETVDSATRSLNLALSWRFYRDWTFEFSAERTTETFAVRPEDDTRAETIGASLQRTF